MYKHHNSNMNSLIRNPTGAQIIKGLFGYDMVREEMVEGDGQMSK